MISSRHLVDRCGTCYRCYFCCYSAILVATVATLLATVLFWLLQCYFACYSCYFTWYSATLLATVLATVLFWLLQLLEGKRPDVMISSGHLVERCGTKAMEQSRSTVGRVSTNRKYRPERERRLLIDT